MKAFKRLFPAETNTARLWAPWTPPSPQSKDYYLTMKRERDDVAAAKDLLSQLSKDDTLLEEVRKLALRGIINSQSGGRGGVVPTHEENSNGRQSSSNSVGTRIDTNHGSSTTSSSSSPIKNGENDGGKELAFTISRDSEMYRSILSTACWYRDALLAGTAGANQTNNVVHNINKNEEHATSTIEYSTKIHIPTYADPSSAMAHPLLLSAADTYLRSISAVNLLRPYVTWAVSCDGPMFPISTQSLVQSITLSQSVCDNAMRDNILWVLKDEGWREFAKSITAKYVDRSYRGGE